MKDLNEIIGLSTYTQGVVEHGTVKVLIGDKSIELTIQEYSNGHHRVLLDDDTPENRKLIESFGVSFEPDSDEIEYDEKGGEFISYIRDIYSNSGTVDGAIWECHDYEELTKDIEE